MYKENLIGQKFMIEYSDVDFVETRRSIIVRSVEAEIFRAFCLLRQEDRSFRFDRVLAVIDGDGEVFTPQDYFGRYGIKIKSYSPSAPSPKAGSSSRITSASNRAGSGGFAALAAAEKRLQPEAPPPQPRKKLRAIAIIAIIVIAAAWLI